MKRSFLLACTAAIACTPADSKLSSAIDTSANTTAAAAAPAPAARDSSASAPAAADSTPPSPEQQSHEWTLTTQGIGPVKLGMTIAEANAAVGNTLDLPRSAEQCLYTRTPKAPAGVRFMIENGVVVLAEARDNKQVKTSEGIGIGDTEAAVMSAYPGQVTVRPAKYTAGHSLLVTPRGTRANTRLVFETDGKTVTQFRSGTLPAVEYVEGCG